MPLEFGPVEFFKAVRQRPWRSVIGLRSNLTLQDGRFLKNLYSHANQGIQGYLKGFD